MFRENRSTIGLIDGCIEIEESFNLCYEMEVRRERQGIKLWHTSWLVPRSPLTTPNTTEKTLLRLATSSDRGFLEGKASRGILRRQPCRMPNTAKHGNGDNYSITQFLQHNQFLLPLTVIMNPAHEFCKSAPCVFVYLLKDLVTPCTLPL